MAGYRNTYGLPDATLQLIGAGPELNFGAAPQGGMSSIISALRGERSSNNPGVRLLANGANGSGMTFNRKPAAASYRFPVLTNPKATRPNTSVTLPVGETGTPYVRPDAPRDPYVPYVPTLGPDADPETPIDPDPPIDPDVPVDPDPVDPDPVDPDPEDPVVDPEEPDVPDVPDVPSIYTKTIDSDIPDDPVDPDTIPLIIPEFPLDLPDIPEVPELNDGSYWDDAQAPEPVGPTRGQPELPEEFDSYLLNEIMNSLFGGGGGGGKYFDDQSAATMAF